MRTAIDFIFRYAAQATMIFSFAVFISWYVDIRSLSPDWVTMKPSTAFSLFCLGWTFWILRRIRFSLLDKFIVWNLSAAVITAMVISHLESFVTILEQITRPDTGVLSVRDNVPSLCTSAAASALAASAVLFIFHIDKVLLRAGGVFASLFCLPAFVGYATGNPALYCYSQGQSTAMALLTAIILQTVAGLAIYLSYRNGYITRVQEELLILKEREAANG